MKSSLVVGALALGLWVPSVAFAVDPAAHDRALELFQKGREAFKASQFQASIDLIKEAYALEPAPVLLYNLAKAYEGLGDIEHAAATYEQYLDEEKEIPDRAAIEAKLKNFKAAIAEKERLAKERDEARAALEKKERESKAGDPKAKPPADAGKRAPSPVPWAFVGVGAAGLVVGGVLGGLAVGKDDDAKAAPSQKDAADLHESAKGLALGSTVGFIAGGVLTGGGLLWGIIDLATRGPAKPAADAAHVRVGPGFVGVDVAF
ncbi:MAG: hypothetical protein U0414_39485 [Polyangiaceae bacterium]